MARVVTTTGIQPESTAFFSFVVMFSMIDGTLRAAFSCTMLIPIFHTAAITYLLSASLSSNTIVPPSPTYFNGNYVSFSDKHQAHLISPDSSSSWLSSTQPAGRPSTAAVIIPSPFRQYNTANDMPLSFYKRSKVIQGRVVKVLDIRLHRCRPYYS